MELEKQIEQSPRDLCYNKERDNVHPRCPRRRGQSEANGVFEEIMMKKSPIWQKI